MPAAMMLIFLLLAVWPVVAIAQTMQQAGPWTQGHAPSYSVLAGSQPYVTDGGGANGLSVASNPLREGLYVAPSAPGGSSAPWTGTGTGPFGANWCNYDGPVTGAYHFLCLSPDAPGGLSQGGLIAYGAGPGATQLPLTINVNGVPYQIPITFTVQCTGNACGINPMSFGCIGNGVADDTTCVQAAITASAAAGMPVYFDGQHLYYTPTGWSSANVVDLEGFAPVGNDGITNLQACTSGLVTNSNITMLNLTGPKVIVRNMCIQMAPLGLSRSSGTAIQLGGSDQQHDIIEGNTIFRPYYGIEFGGAGGLVRDSYAGHNVVRDPTGIGMTVGRGTTGGVTANEQLVDNRIGCDAGASGTGIGFAFFDGAVNFDGGPVGSSNCAIGTEVVPGANQNANGQFKGVLGDSSGTHNGGAQAYDLFIQPSAASGVVEWLEFTTVWASAVVANDTPVYIAAFDAAHNSNCSNIKFNGLTSHSDDNAGTAPAIVDIEGCQNIIIAGSTLDAWLSGTTTNGLKIGQGSGNPAHIAVGTTHIGSEAGATLTNGITITGTGGGPAYIDIVGNELNQASTPFNFTSSNAVQILTVKDNSGIDDNACSNTNITAAAAITVPSSISCATLTGSVTTITDITLSGWANRKFTLLNGESGSITFAIGGSTRGFCGANLTVPPGGAAFIQNMPTCWQAK